MTGESGFVWGTTVSLGIEAIQPIFFLNTQLVFFPDKKKDKSNRETLGKTKQKLRAHGSFWNILSNYEATRTEKQMSSFDEKVQSRKKNTGN